MAQTLYNQKQHVATSGKSFLTPLGHFSGRRRRCAINDDLSQGVLSTFSCGQGVVLSR